MSPLATLHKTPIWLPPPPVTLEDMPTLSLELVFWPPSSFTSPLLWPTSKMRRVQRTWDNTVRQIMLFDDLDLVEVLERKRRISCHFFPFFFFFFFRFRIALCLPRSQLCVIRPCEIGKVEKHCLVCSLPSMLLGIVRSHNLQIEPLQRDGKGKTTLFLPRR